MNSCCELSSSSFSSFIDLHQYLKPKLCEKCKICGIFEHLCDKKICIYCQIKKRKQNKITNNKIINNKKSCINY